MCVRRLTVLVVVAIALGCGRRDARLKDASVASIPAEVQGAPALFNTETELVQSLEPVVERLVEGRPVFRSGAGVAAWATAARTRRRRADRERQRANTVDTPFALASVSKMVTRVVVAQLVEQGVISLDASIYPHDQALFWRAPRTSIDSDPRGQKQYRGGKR
jgi:CubicO group peptidase (beta-lactamase class C family)